MISPACTRLVLAVLVRARLGSRTGTVVERSSGTLVTPGSENAVVAVLVMTAPSCTSRRLETTTGMSTANVEGLVASTAGCRVNTPVPASQTAPVMPPENA